MTTKPPTPFTVGQGFVGTWQGDVLVEVSAPYVPILLHRLEVYTLAFAYSTPADYELGYQATVTQQEALLANIGDRIISEVRALRDGQLTAPADRDPALDPYTLPLTSLSDINSNVQFQTQDIGDKLDTANSTLLDILAAVQASGGSPEVLDKLDTLIFLLGAL